MDWEINGEWENGDTALYGSFVKTEGKWTLIPRGILDCGENKN